MAGEGAAATATSRRELLREAVPEGDIHTGGGAAPAVRGDDAGAGAARCSDAQRRRPRRSEPSLFVSEVTFGAGRRSVSWTGRRTVVRDETTFRADDALDDDGPFGIDDDTAEADGLEAAAALRPAGHAAARPRASGAWRCACGRASSSGLLEATDAARCRGACPRASGSWPSSTGSAARRRWMRTRHGPPASIR
ncbi:MAG: hypothetical protein WKF78_02825 [Candidatus Limnocylindrales bacterium]